MHVEFHVRQPGTPRIDRCVIRVKNEGPVPKPNVDIVSNLGRCLARLPYLEFIDLETGSGLDGISFDEEDVKSLPSYLRLLPFSPGPTARSTIQTTFPASRHTI